MSVFDAFHLPGLDASRVTDWLETRRGAVKIRSPRLTPALVRTVIAHITDSRDAYLRNAPVLRIAAAISAAASRLQNTQSPQYALARELLPAVTGYSEATIELTLRNMARDWCADSLSRMLRAELADPAVLDGPTPDPNVPERLVAAYGPRLAFHIFAGNVPGVAVTSCIRSLLVKAATFGKAASDEPVLAVLFAQALHAVAPELAACLAVTYWPGGTHELEDVLLNEADMVIVYGSEETVKQVHARVPIATRVIVHGPRLSLGIVGHRALESIDSSASLAREIALATAAYDQQGCVSPHAVYVQSGVAVAPRQLARLIADALAELANALPRRQLSAGEALAIRNARARAEFRAAESHAAEVYASEDTGYTVIYDDDTAFITSCLNRLLYIKPFTTSSELVSALQPYRAVLQSVAIAGFSQNDMSALAQELGRIGVSRLTSFAQLPWPPMYWHHDGSSPLGELLWWQNIER